MEWWYPFIYFVIVIRMKRKNGGKFQWNKTSFFDCWYESKDTTAIKYGWHLLQLQRYWDKKDDEMTTFFSICQGRKKRCIIHILTKVVSELLLHIFHVRLEQNNGDIAWSYPKTGSFMCSQQSRMITSNDEDLEWSYIDVILVHLLVNCMQYCAPNTLHWMAIVFTVVKLDFAAWKGSNWPNCKNKAHCNCDGSNLEISGPPLSFIKGRMIWVFCPHFPSSFWKANAIPTKHKAPSR